MGVKAFRMGRRWLALENRRVFSGLRGSHRARRKINELASDFTRVILWITLWVNPRAGG
jgi:hypothetical protein